MLNFILHYLEQANQIALLLIALLLLREWIRKLRKERLGYTQEEFAELFGVEPRTVQRWEQGKREPRREHLLAMQKLQKTDDMTIDQLFEEFFSDERRKYLYEGAQIEISPCRYDIQ